MPIRSEFKIQNCWASYLPVKQKVERLLALNMKGSG